MRSSTLKASGAVVLTALLAACASDPPPPRTGMMPPCRRSQTPYVIAPLDLARVKLKRDEVQVLSVSPEGTLAFADETRSVAGMPVEKFRTLLRGKYPDAREIEIEEFRPNRVSVLGEVFHQIHTDLGDGPMRVLDVIASANGFTPLANKRRVKLIRANAGSVEVYELDLREMMQGADLGQNLLLKPGDVITVPRNFL